MLLAVVWARPSTAQSSTAQSSAADRASAEALFNQALEDIDAGRHAEACPRLEESQKLDPGVGTLLYLADCYQTLGRTASAWGTFVEAAYAAEAAGQLERKETATRYALQLQERLSYIVLEVAAPLAPGLRVQNDDREIGQARWGMELPIDPGKHRLHAAAPGFTSWSEDIFIPPEPGATYYRIPPLSTAVKLPPPVAVENSTSSVSNTVVAPATEAGEQVSSNRMLWAYTALGAGAVSAAGAGVLSWLALAQEETADLSCRRDEPTLCSHAGLDAADGARTKANIASALSGVAAALVATGVVLWLTAPEEDAASVNVSPFVAQAGSASTPSSTVGLRLDGAW